ncbi:xylulose kinase [Nakamurella sp. YIM 132087]|uniref:Xylulose kinase n=1 Tax=Nakamurella alba TaxID=2665158 RepID=A0A7K1FS23_9ACTN|nr:FGGY family carbohydrate kinase [Nakamurella alba]MTD16938.1 xylulose kinase [Nakamurella alba]
MTTVPAVLGIDLGTSSVKVALTDQVGAVVAQAVCDYPVDRRNPGWAETDPEAWWQAIRTATAQVLATAPAASVAGIAGIGLSGQMHGVVLSDAEHRPVRPAVLWADARAEPQLDLLRALDLSVRARLANPLSPGMAGPVLAWLHVHEPEVLDAARHALQPKDWIRAWLTGVAAGEPSDASATLLFDVLAADWDDEVVTALGIDRRLLPDLLPSALTEAGRLTTAAAEALGLQAGLPVAAGAGDTAAAALGSGLFEPGTVQLTIGTGVQIVTVVPAPTAESVAGLHDPVTHLYRSATAHGWYAMAAGLTGGQSLDWVRRILGAEWSELYGVADRGSRPDDPVFLPHLVGERTPYLDTNMRGAWTGLDARHDRVALLHSALEGVAFAVADCLDALPGIPSGNRDLRLAGGGTTAPAWRQLLADVLEARLHAVDVPGASARGAALIGARAAGLLDDARLTEVATPHTTLIAEPGPAAEALRDRRFRYRDTLARLRA